MPHTYLVNLIHIVFSTKERRPLIRTEIRGRLWDYLSGIALNHGFKVIEVGGTTDHVHLLLEVPGTIPVSKAVQLLKTNSSKWMRESVPEQRLFGWQEGFGGFSVSQSHKQQVRKYIATQEEHHRKMSFAEEWAKLLAKHGLKQAEDGSFD